MPIDPMTGIADYGGQGRSGLPGGDVMESIPGVSTTTMINAGRYSNTLFARWSI
jgi:hypothetical protein